MELQKVLEIQKLGHRRRILQSISFMKPAHDGKSPRTPQAETNATNRLVNSSSNGQQQRNSVGGYRKNRPAPQPPTSAQQKATQQTPAALQIRNPSELLLGLPDNLRTKWRHSANSLLNDQIKYEVYVSGPSRYGMPWQEFLFNHSTFFFVVFLF